jgi:hypothetical protein
MKIQLESEQLIEILLPFVRYKKGIAKDMPITHVHINDGGVITINDYIRLQNLYNDIIRQLNQTEQS